MPSNDVQYTVKRPVPWVTDSKEEHLLLFSNNKVLKLDFNHQLGYIQPKYIFLSVPYIIPTNQILDNKTKKKVIITKIFHLILFRPLRTGNGIRSSISGSLILSCLRNYNILCVSIFLKALLAVQTCWINNMVNC